MVESKTLIYLQNRIVIEVPSVNVAEIKRMIPREIKIEGIQTDREFFRKAADEAGKIIWRKTDGK